jgi:hypothetical protein
MARDEQLQRRRGAVLQRNPIFFLDRYFRISRKWSGVGGTGFSDFVGGRDFGHKKVPFAKQVIGLGQKHYSDPRSHGNGNAAGPKNV